MNLLDILQQLSSGEFAQLTLSHDVLEGEENVDADFNESGIKAEFLPRVIRAIDLGLLALYTRFRLKEGEILIEMDADTSVYPLDSCNLLKIEAVYDTANTELPLNIVGDPYSLQTPTYDYLAVPDSVRDSSATLKVCYRATHPKIDLHLAAASPASVTLELPITHLEALLYFVASRIFMPVGLTGDFHEGNNYASRFEVKCQELEHHNFAIDNIGEENKFSQRGWI